jgi:hypothetical protein
MTYGLMTGVSPGQRTHAGQPGASQQLLPSSRPASAGSSAAIAMGTGGRAPAPVRLPLSRPRRSHRFLDTCHAADDSGGHQQNRVCTR